MSDPTSTPTPGTFWRRVRFFTLVTTLILLVLYSGLDWWSGRQLDRQLASFEAKHGRLSGQPSKPNVPETDNRARLVRAAAALVNAPQESLGRAVKELQNPKSTIVVDDERRALVNGSQDALRLLAGIDSRRQTSWDVNGPELLEIRQLGNIVYLSALIDLAEGRADQSVDKVIEGLDVSNSLANEPTLIAQLIRIAVGVPPLDVTQRLLTQAEPSRPALDKLAQRLAECRRPDPMRAGLLGDAANVNLVLGQAEAGRTSTGADPFPLAGPFGRLARPLVRLVRKSYVAQMERSLDQQTGPRPRTAPAVLPQPHWWSPVDRLVSTVLPGLERAIDAGDDFSAALAGAEIAVALRRYRLDAGAYPDRLAVLVPAYLDAVPIDPFTGAPPVYARQASGFSLHAGRWPYRPLVDWIVTK